MFSVEIFLSCFAALWAFSSILILCVSAGTVITMAIREGRDFISAVGMTLLCVIGSLFGPIAIAAIVIYEDF